MTLSTTLTGQQIYEILRVKRAALGLGTAEWWDSDSRERSAFDVLAMELNRLTEPVERTQ